MARISALARALKASGSGAGIDLLRAEVFIGLLLGTLPYIPPPADGPPDPEPPAGDPPDPEPPAGDPAGRDPSGRRTASRSEAGATKGRSRPRRRDGRSDSRDPGSRSDAESSVGQSGPGASGGRSGPGATDDLTDAGLNEPHEDGTDDGDLGWAGDRDGVTAGGFGYGADDDDTLRARPPPTWPEVPVFLQPGPAAMGHLRPAQGGMLDLRLSWGTLVGESAEPGYLGRLGPITPAQARLLAEIATGDRAVDWRVVVTGPDNRALSVGRIPRKPARAGPAGLVKRVTVSITLDQLARSAADLPPALSSVLSAAKRAVSQVAERTPADAERTPTDADPEGANSRVAGSGGAGAGGAGAGGAGSGDACSHAKATSAYRPSPWLREFVIARDQTCRFLTCRQPAWRCDLDHTEPYDQGGRTCACNLGCLCRFHHQLKQHRRWQLIQSAPGTFTWITPGGRTYATLPDSYPA
jgi:hypothetical protein